MILRIEIYDAISYEQIREARRIIATFLNVPMESIMVEELPEAEEGEYTPPTHPEEGDWVTEDYKHWHEFNGKKRIELAAHGEWAEQMKGIMEVEQWWPNLWLLGERGEWNLLSIQSGKYFLEG